MKRPQLSRAEAEAFAKMLSVTETTYWVAIRGYYLNTMGKIGLNDRGLYDDAICLVTPTSFHAFNANTDPSKFTGHIATLIPGKHLFKKGNHGISKPGGGYPAFRPATPDESLPVTRDGENGVFKGIAINIHKGGYNTTSSAGCQTIHPDQWAEFKKLSDKAMDDAGIKKMPYFLVVNPDHI